MTAGRNRSIGHPRSIVETRVIADAHAVNELGGGIVSHGNGRYATTLFGHGTLTNGVIVESTTHELTCAVDTDAETLDCTGDRRPPHGLRRREV